ncbi:MAG: hypothetical protein ON057_000197 [Glomeribacter sp. 1016415]|nr:hypothetical protein [Glomeribacter sp. 1016415]
MITFTETFSSVREIKQSFQDRYERWLILGSNHEAINECYSIESDSNELDFGLGVAIAGTGIMPKIFFSEIYQTLYVGFDSYIAAVPIIQPFSTIESRLSELNWVFFDLFPLKNGNICVIDEIGAQVFTRDLTKVWSFIKDIVSDWVLNEEQGMLSLTLMDTEEVINFSITTGAILPA